MGFEKQTKISIFQKKVDALHLMQLTTGLCNMHY